jgi:hypothetical protein
MAYSPHAYDPQVEDRFVEGKWYQIIQPNTDTLDRTDGSRVKWTSELDAAVGSIYQCHTAFYGGRHAFLYGTGRFAVHIDWVKGPYDTEEQAQMSKKIKVYPKEPKAEDIAKIDRAVDLLAEHRNLLTGWEIGFVGSLNQNYRKRQLSAKQRSCLDKILLKEPEIKIEPLKVPDYQSVEDIEYFQKKLVGALKVPKDLLETRHDDNGYHAFDGEEWVDGSPTTYVKSKGWQKQAKRLIDGGIDYQKLHKDSGSPYVKGELTKIEEITDLEGDKVYKRLRTEWKDPVTGMISVHEEERGNDNPWGFPSNQNPCGEVALKYSGPPSHKEYNELPEPTMCNLREVQYNPMDDEDDFFIAPTKPRTLEERMRDLDRECYDETRKVEAERNFRDQKRRIRRDREGELAERLVPTPARKAKTRWGWVLAGVLTVASIVGGTYAYAYHALGITPSDVQQTVVEHANDLLGR